MKTITLGVAQSEQICGEVIGLSCERDGGDQSADLMDMVTGSFVGTCPHS
jgi:hypothetical protein